MHQYNMIYFINSYTFFRYLKEDLKQMLTDDNLLKTIDRLQLTYFFLTIYKFNKVQFPEGSKNVITFAESPGQIAPETFQMIQGHLRTEGMQKNFCFQPFIDILEYNIVIIINEEYFQNQFTGSTQSAHPMKSQQLLIEEVLVLQFFENCGFFQSKLQIVGWTIIYIDRLMNSPQNFQFQIISRELDLDRTRQSMNLDLSFDLRSVAQNILESDQRQNEPICLLQGKSSQLMSNSIKCFEDLHQGMNKKPEKFEPELQDKQQKQIAQQQNQELMKQYLESKVRKQKYQEQQQYDRKWQQKYLERWQQDLNGREQKQKYLEQWQLDLRKKQKDLEQQQYDRKWQQKHLERWQQDLNGREQKQKYLEQWQLDLKKKQKDLEHWQQDLKNKDKKQKDLEQWQLDLKKKQKDLEHWQLDLQSKDNNLIMKQQKLRGKEQKYISKQLSLKNKLEISEDEKIDLLQKIGHLRESLKEKDRRILYLQKRKNI